MKFTSQTFLSKDGTPIHYQQTGSGEGLILVNGAGRAAKHFQKLACSLANRFQVTIYDRRGRGASGNITTDHNIQHEIDDLTELLKITHSKYMFGHSFGGLLVLETALQISLEKIAVYDPGISINKSLPHEWLNEFDIALAKQETEKAMVVGLKGLQLHGVSKLPSWSLQLLAKVLILKEQEDEIEEGMRMTDLLPTMSTDVKLIMQLDSTQERYRKIQTPTLLMEGTESPEFLKQTTASLKSLLPHSETHIFDKFNHYSPETMTDDIAEVLKGFFNNV
jgi:pimeloyl-ACP methyl ester carboxylesterase